MNETLTKQAFTAKLYVTVGDYLSLPEPHFMIVSDLTQHTVVSLGSADARFPDYETAGTALGGGAAKMEGRAAADCARSAARWTAHLCPSHFVADMLDCHFDPDKITVSAQRAHHHRRC